MWGTSLLPILPIPPTGIMFQGRLPSTCDEGTFSLVKGHLWPRDPTGFKDVYVSSGEGRWPTDPRVVRGSRSTAPPPLALGRVLRDNPPLGTLP